MAMNVSSKKRQIVFLLLYSLILTFLVSGILVLTLSGGIKPHFMSSWIENWTVAFLTAYVLNLFLPKPIRYLARKFQRGSKIVTLFLFPLIMTCMISFTLTLFNQRGFDSNFSGTWMEAWSIAFVAVFIISRFLPHFVGKLVSRMVAYSSSRAYVKETEGE
ncbi:DUF2798 domain-containing protein [Paenibacillus sp. MWE-103]|uniref:DUF2798 domain-containing protein n=1 Tax=Paenibacillus artemisiicola TaxID=1172618 RepID=A0ABS3W5N4_9BACL|nr:DUF2798 domain-containing protein [Paenibacillus artemisiicola]